MRRVRIHWRARLRDVREAVAFTLVLSVPFVAFAVLLGWFQGVVWCRWLCLSLIAALVAWAFWLWLTQDDAEGGL